MNESMQLGDFLLVNPDKVRRAIEGEPRRGGVPEGGVGREASDAVILAAYDKLGGLVRKDGRNLKIGCFWDFKNKKAREIPEVVFILDGINGKKYEVADGEEVPLEVKVAENEKKAGAPVKKGKKSKKSIEDEE